MDSTARLILDIGFYGFQRCAATGNNALEIMLKLGFAPVHLVYFCFIS